MTREEYYNAVILHTEGKDGEKLAATRKSLEKTKYQQWLEGAAQRGKEREQALQTKAAIQPPAKVAKLRKTLEDTEREITETLKAEEAGEQERNEEGLSAYAGSVDRMRAELRSMTPAERNMASIN